MVKTTTTTERKEKNAVPKVSYHYRPEGMTLEAWQIALRQQAALKEQFIIAAMNEKQYPGDYKVSNSVSKSECKVVFRGEGNQWNYCSCMDFKTSQPCIYSTPPEKSLTPSIRPKN